MVWYISLVILIVFVSQQSGSAGNGSPGYDNLGLEVRITPEDAGWSFECSLSVVIYIYGHNI